MYIGNLVVDASRRFVSTPKALKPTLMYRRRLEDALRLFAYNHVHVEYLWLGNGFDIGPFINDIASCSIHAVGEFTVETVYILDDRDSFKLDSIYRMCESFSEDVHLIHSEDYGLMNR